MPDRVPLDVPGLSGRGEIFRIKGSQLRDSSVEHWLAADSELRAIARTWFHRIRQCGDDVRETLHDGYPVACVEDAPFAYVNTFKAHASVGFFQGADLADPAGMLEGGGRRMRHVKLRPGQSLDAAALARLIEAAHATIRASLAAEGEMTMKKTPSSHEPSASARIDQKIAAMGDWRGNVLAKLPAVILSADPGVIEEWKWDGPVWSCAGVICTGETYKKAVKMTFANGASLADPSGLFNASLEGKTRRAIDVHEGDPINEKALRALIQTAVKFNVARMKAKG